MKAEKKAEKLIGGIVNSKRNTFAIIEGHVMTEVRLFTILGVKDYPLLLLRELIPQLEKKIQELRESPWYRGKEMVEKGERLLEESKWFLEAIEGDRWPLSLFSFSFKEVETLDKATQEMILHPTYYWFDYFRYLDEVRLGRIPGEENGAGHFNFIDEIAEGKYCCYPEGGKKIIIQFPCSLSKKAEIFRKEYYEATREQQERALQNLQEAGEHPERAKEIIQREEERKKEGLTEHVRWLDRKHSVETEAIVFVIQHLTQKSPHF